MSNISDRHNVNLFVAGKSAALSGQRLARVGYKNTAENKEKGFKSICVSVPFVSLSDEDMVTYQSAFRTILQNVLQDAQDGIIKSLYESSGGTLTSVSDSDLGIIQALAFIESENNGGRLSKEFLEVWFDNVLAENLTVVIADKLGFSDLSESEMEVISKHLTGYKGLISSLAGNKTILSPVQINGIRRALEVSAVDDETVQKLRNKLDVLEKKPKMEELLEL